MKALIFEGKVIELSEIEFPVHKDMKWVNALPETIVGWVYEDGSLSPPPEPEPPTYVDLRLAAYPPIGDQLDAIWKELDRRRDSGENILPETEQVLDEIISVKSQYPKPVE